MRRITITEMHNLYVVETSDGRRGSGSSLRSAMDQVTPRTTDDMESLERIFDGILPREAGQIQQGRASG